MKKKILVIITILILNFVLFVTPTFAYSYEDYTYPDIEIDQEGLTAVWSDFTGSPESFCWIPLYYYFEYGSPAYDGQNILHVYMIYNYFDDYHMTFGEWRVGELIATEGNYYNGGSWISFYNDNIINNPDSLPGWRYYVPPYNRPTFTLTGYGNYRFIDNPWQYLHFTDPEALQESYDEGYSDGYDVGFQQYPQLNPDYTSATGMITTAINAPFQAIFNALNFEVFGINFAALVFFILTVAIIAAVIAILRSVK